MARLHSRIYLHFLGVLLVAGLVASAAFAVGTRGGVFREIAERLVRHVVSLTAERFADPSALAERLRQLHADLDLDVVARDLDGRVVAAAGRTLPPLSDAQAAEVRGGKVIVDARPAWRAVAPLRDARTGAIIGTIEIATRRRFTGPHLLLPALGVAATLLVVAAATRPLARRISRPIERLTEGARRLGAGDLGYRVPDPPEPGRTGPSSLIWRRWTPPWRRASDELAELTRSFNDMAARVERLVRGQRELLANVSHELRSPLARIRVALELLPQEGETGRRIGDIEADLGELDRLIEDVLTTARLDATGLPMRLAPVAPDELLAQIAERARQDPVVGGREVRVLPGASEPIIADGGLLRRAIWNLVENAAKYGAPPITLTASRAGDRVSFSVTDDGPGIAREDRERVTMPFYRGDVARTPGGPGEPPRGVGLGLTLAKRVAEVHEGALVIEAARVADGRERGCRVTISIPVSLGGRATVP